MSSEKNQVLTSYFEIAEQKSWLKKEAAVEPQVINLTGTGDFNNDILVLIAGLKEKGLDKYAEELAQNYLNFKKTETHLYKVHPEKENALLEFAHPDGDAAVCDASEELGTVETLFTAQKKDMHAATNPAIGKLGSSHQVVELIKTALKKKAENSQELHQQFLTIANKIKDDFELLKSLVQKSLTFNMESTGFWGKSSPGNFFKALFGNKVDEAVEIFQEIKSRLEPGLLGGVSKSKWLEINPLIERINSNLGLANKLSQHYHQLKGQEIIQSPIKSTGNTKQEELTKLINFYLTKINDKPNKIALEKWLNEAKQSLVGAKPEVEREVEEKLIKFKTKWLS